MKIAASTSPSKGSCASAQDDIIQITGIPELKTWKPSRFNARVVSDDGTLILYNSLTGAFSGFRPGMRSEVEAMLRRRGISARVEGLTKYLSERGYIVEERANEFERFRLARGNAQYRRDALELILLASEECNFRCVYCYEDFARGTMEPWVRRSIIEMIERRASTLNTLAISWFGGEPLLGLEAIREIAPAALEISQRHSLPFRSDMTTNGYLLTPDVFRELISWNIRGFQITIDGTPEAHNQKRVLKGGGDTFDTIMANLRATRLETQPFGITIRINFDKNNLSRMEALTDELKREFGDDCRYQLRFYPVGTWGGPNDDKLEVCGMSAGHETQSLQLMAHRKGINVESKLPYMQPSTGLGVCYAARPYNLLIGADGKIMKCTIALDTADHNIVGHLTKDGRAQLDVDKLSRWVAPYYEDDAHCKSCFYVPVCQGCSCPLVRIESGSRPCPEEKTRIGPSLKTVWALKKKRANTFDLATSQLTKFEIPAPVAKV